MQLVDDCVDVLADRRNGIHTIATHDLQTKGNLDDLWIEIMHRISLIHPRFKVFIILYSIFAVYVPDRVPQMFTEQLRTKTTELNLFAGCDGSSLLIESIMNELLAKDLLTDIQ